MAVKICTTGGSCITCTDKTAIQVTDAVKSGGIFFCCDRGTKCVAISHITTIVETRSPGDGDGDDDDRGWGGRDIDLGHPEVVIVTGGR